MPSYMIPGLGIRDDSGRLFTPGNVEPYTNLAVDNPASRARGVQWDPKTGSWKRSANASGTMPAPSGAQPRVPAGLPQFFPVNYPKSPELTAAERRAAGRAEAGIAATEKGFDDYLKDYRSQLAVQRGVLDKGEEAIRRDEAALAEGDLADRFRAPRLRQGSLRGEVARQALDYNTRNFKTARAGRPSLGDSGEEQRQAMDAASRVLAPLEYQAAEGALADERYLDERRRSNAGRLFSERAQQAALQSGYMNALDQPVLRRLQMLPLFSGLDTQGIQNNLAVNYHRLLRPLEGDVGATPFFNAGYPDVRGGGYNVPRDEQPQGRPRDEQPQGRPRDEQPQGRPRSAAEQAYYDQTGFWPRGDPLFSPTAYIGAGGGGQYEGNVMGRAFKDAIQEFESFTGTNDTSTDPAFWNQIARRHGIQF